MFTSKQTKRTSRLLCLLLVLCLISLGACSEKKPEEKAPAAADASPSDPDAGTETQAVETEPEYVFEEADYGGRDFTVFAARDFVGEIYAEEQTGSLANDVIRDRNLTVESQYNVRIGVQEGDSNNANDFPKLKAMVAAGESGIDLVDIHAYKAHNLILADCLVNWHEIPGAELSNP